MDAEKLMTALYEKAKAEQDKYRSWLVAQPPAEILNHCYEYSVREDLVIELSEVVLSAEQAEALLSSPCPVADLYKDYRDMESRYMSDLEDCIFCRADEIIRRNEELYKAPVYKYPADYARENGELEQYRTSRKANIACKNAIEKAISSHHDMYSFDSRAAVQDVVKKFGYERTLYVLAATVRSMEHDGRFSINNKNWARTMPVFEDIGAYGEDRNREFAVSSHPVHTDAFTAAARHEHLLSLPLTKEDIKAEALNILCKFQDARQPNSPNGTHYMAQVSPDFLMRAKSKDTDRLISMLPFQTLSLSTLEGRKGTFALISKDENRFQKLVLRKPSVRKKLQQPTADAPKPPKKNKVKDQER